MFGSEVPSRSGFKLSRMEFLGDSGFQVFKDRESPGSLSIGFSDFPVRYLTEVSEGGGAPRGSHGAPNHSVTMKLFREESYS